MPVEVGPPPKLTIRRHKYREFYSKLTSLAPEWVSLPLDEIAGDNNTKKAGNIISGAHRLGFRVQTTIQEGRLFARVVQPPQEQQQA